MMELLQRTLDGILAQRDLDDPRSDAWDHLHHHGLLAPFQNGLTRWSEGGALIRIASRHAPGVPFAEHVVASHLARILELSTPHTHVTLADPFASELVFSNGHVTGIARLVPHASLSDHLWLEAQASSDERVLALVPMRGVEATAGQNLAEEPRDTLVLRGLPVAACMPFAQAQGMLSWVGALARATQMAALAERVLELSLEHANTRKQFGAAVASFQAVQQQLAVLGCEVAASNCAVDAAERALDEATRDVFPHAAEAIAIAKVQAGRVARVACEVGHAVHAAIGYTREHSLRRYTQRLLSYRAEFAAERWFAARLGARARMRGGDKLWDGLLESASVSAKESQS
jgi:acyl-CoA dehydrogenase